jgi:hypothetical protein
MHHHDVVEAVRTQLVAHYLALEAVQSTAEGDDLG